MSRSIGVLLGASLAPMVLGVMLVHPASAGVDPYLTFGMTAVASSIRTDGDVGVGGGLARLDSGIAFVSATLDSAPSADVLAAPFEPGTLARTVAGQGGQNQQIPDAEAQYPGGKGVEVLTTVPAVDNPAVHALSGSATARATSDSASGTALGVDAVIGGLVEIEGAATQVVLKANAPLAQLTATARTSVGKIMIAGVLELTGVSATASISASSDKHLPKADFVLGGAAVAGQQVAIGANGVTAGGSTLLDPQMVRDATVAANAVLTAAGITIHTLAKTEAATKDSAFADSGGLAISVVTAALPGGLPGNTLELVVGGVSLTEAATQPEALVPPLPTPTPTTSESLPEIGTGGTEGPTSPAIDSPPISGEAQPTTASRTEPARWMIAGHRVRASLAIVAFIAWQVFTLGTAAMCGVLQRRHPEDVGEVL